MGLCWWMHTLSMGLKALEETYLCHREMRRSSRGLRSRGSVCVRVCVFREISPLESSNWNTRIHLQTLNLLKWLLYISCLSVCLSKDVGKLEGTDYFLWAIKVYTTRATSVIDYRSSYQCFSVTFQLYTFCYWHAIIRTIVAYGTISNPQSYFYHCPLCPLPGKYVLRSIKYCIYVV